MAPEVARLAGARAGLRRDGGGVRRARRLAAVGIDPTRRRVGRAAASSLDAAPPRSRAESAQSGAGGGPRRAGDSAAEPSTTLASPVPPPAGDGSPRSDGRDRRKVERSASLTLATKPGDVDAVSARIQDVTRRQGGFVASSSVSSQQGGDFELRIPTRNLDAAMAALSRLGAVRDRQQRSEDITAQSVSARSRLKDARTERKSLLDQLADADTVTEAGAIRARLRLVSNEIEVAKAAVRRVDNRADFATVSVALVADSGRGRARRPPRTTAGPPATRRATRSACSRSPRASR